MVCFGIKVISGLSGDYKELRIDSDALIVEVVSYVGHGHVHLVKVPMLKVKIKQIII